LPLITFRNACSSIFRRYTPFGAFNQKRGG
jgi:hypothetical protein